VNVDAYGVFPPGTPLLALPSWREPRVVLSNLGSPMRRWRDSAFYPATRSTARLYRLALRGKAAAGWGEVRRASYCRWRLREFIGDCLPPLGSAVLQTRPSGPAQKFTIQLHDRFGAIIGYIKYASEPLAQRRLTQEHAMLVRVPAGLGPVPLKFGQMGDGLALLVTPVRGRYVRAKLPPTRKVLEFAYSLQVSPAIALAAHPYVCAMRERVGTRLDGIFEDLRVRTWPIVLQHGDLVPWNLRWSRNSKSLSAFDWEFGTPNGFPYIDLAQFIMQVAFLIYSCPPVASATYATRWLAGQSAHGLTEREARAVVRLAMFGAYTWAEEEYPDSHPIQIWRRSIWEGLW